MGLIWQVIYYKQLKNEEAILPSETTSLLNNSQAKRHSQKIQLFNFFSALSIIVVAIVSCYTYTKNHCIHRENYKDAQLQLLPQIMGWTSAVLYVGSRIPQIVKNWKHKSTEGLSLGMFLCAVMGNILFTMVKYHV